MGHTAHANVVGRPPLRIVCFRCFGNAARARTFLEGAWREFGYVHLLRHPESATWRELLRWRKPPAMAELVITGEEQLRDRLLRLPAEPGRRGPFGEYPVREFFCANAFWQSSGLQFELERAPLPGDQNGVPAPGKRSGPSD